MLNKAGSIFDRILDLTIYICGVLVGIPYIFVFVGVLLRYFANKSVLWPNEITEYAMVTFTFLGAAWVLQREQHVSLDVVTSRLRQKTRATLNAITSIVGALLSGLILWYGTVETLIIFQSNTTVDNKVMNLPLGPFIAVIPLSFLLLFIQFIRRAIKFIQLRKKIEEENTRKKMLISQKA